MNDKTTVKNIYLWPVGISMLVLLAVLWRGGGGAFGAVLVLAVLEITFSFDNAIINSHVLAKLSYVWRRIFLTVGIAIAVFGVRLLLPVVLVAISSHSGVADITRLALNNPDLYAAKLNQAYPMIAAFGGFFLGSIALDFLFTKQKTTWLTPLEKFLVKLHHPALGTLVIDLFGLVALFLWQGTARRDIYLAAILGIVTFTIISTLSTTLEKRSLANSAHPKHSWRFGLAQFLYLEILDASFSFDGVIAAFAITKQVLLIATGLGIGALYVRSMTVHLLEKGTLAQYKYLSHGAHYAILALSIILIISTRRAVPDYITGLIGLAIIAASIVSSRRNSKIEYNQSQI